MEFIRRSLLLIIIFRENLNNFKFSFDRIVKKKNYKRLLYDSKNEFIK